MTDELVTTLLDRADGTARLIVTGEIDFATAPLLREAIDNALTSDTTLVIDLRAVTYLDSAGIDVLFEQAERRTIELAVNPRGPVLRILRISGLVQAVPVHEHKADADS
ncbi:STAS domain-containing protein [Saccharothrix hoggarensis]|uniref:Anti-sigma factor antagonist n=1 Tax=Saccharothrix hoggarensis TaxID=913853 RepID=A0ABW3QUJ6_9PSEU